MMTRHGLTGAAAVRVTGANAADRADGSMVIQVNLAVDGTPIRIQTPVPGQGNILAALTRLDGRIRWMRGLRQPRPWPDPTRPLLAVTAGGSVVRRKTIGPAVCDPSAAARTLDALDYDVHLFTDTETGQDAVVFRAGPTGIRLARQRSGHPPPSGPILLTVQAIAPAARTDGQAADRLRGYGLPFLFYIHPASRRGRVVYRRYDGGLTLLAAETP
jgi:hypothetical protein